jgi:chromosome segregation ATPase
MNLTQFITSLQLIIAHLYDNIDSLKKKNDDLESLVIIQKKQIQQLYDDNEHHKIHNLKLNNDCDLLEKKNSILKEDIQLLNDKIEGLSTRNSKLFNEIQFLQSRYIEYHNLYYNLKNKDKDKNNNDLNMCDYIGIFLASFSVLIIFWFILVCLRII